MLKMKRPKRFLFFDLVHEMRNTEFTSWLAGYILLSDAQSLTASQRRCIRDHARLCEYTEHGKLTITNFMILNDLDILDDNLIFAHALHQYRSIPIPTSNDICYFLQGFFEISESRVWSRAAAEVCLEEIDLNVHGLETSIIILYYRLKRFLDTREESIDMSDVRDQLMGVFQHVIDPSYDYDPQIADAIHNGVDTATPQNPQMNDTP